MLNGQGTALDLPSFLWLWRIAAWSMGFSLVTYSFLAITGLNLFGQRQAASPPSPWLRWTHIILGGILVGLVLLLLAIGVVGTLGHYGSLGHSIHAWTGWVVAGLVLLSAGAATQIKTHPWARLLHVSINALLFLGFAFVSLSGWSVVQKYL